MVTSFIPESIESPCFVIDTALLKKNLETVSQIKKRAGIKILMAQKAFSTFELYPQIAEKLDGVAASGLYEAKLGSEHFKKEVHTYCPAFRDDEINTICELSDHVIFNSAGQIDKFKQQIKNYSDTTSFGLRVNPECSVTSPPIYDPCAPGSRLGVTQQQIKNADLSPIKGFHFHALCEQNSDALEKVLLTFEKRFAQFLPALKWVNIGGGHNFTSDDYNIDHFVRIITGFKRRHPALEIFAEPGSAVVRDTGVLVAQVLDIVENSGKTAILDISCTCHTPDIIEMPYRASVQNEVPLNKAKYKYRLGGISCLAGDNFGEYGFNRELNTGDKIIFNDMAHYTTVKTTMFNGVRHPSIALYNSKDGSHRVIKSFSYNDFKNRLG
jgi:carboxynorspermidine decarboxylase